jgi:hypothetical protein
MNKFGWTSWFLLVAGIVLRCVALNQPLVDAGLLRQCQTAAYTQSLIEQGGFPLDVQLPWAGDSGARYVLEFPLYNFLVGGVHAVTGMLDLSGKMVTVLLWAASFILLQGLWRRILDAGQTFWANLLFVFAPLGVFYGQAFMPEMLVQVLAFGFLLLVLRYVEEPSLPRWLACGSVGLVALLVKLPETSHLYLILGVLLFQREGWKVAWRPRYLIAAVLTAAAIKGWSTYMDSVNIDPLSFGGSRENLRAFLGSVGERFTVRPWVMIAAYVGVFILPGVAAPVTLYGFWVQIRERVRPFLSLWLLSLALFYLLWLGNTAAKQSYYNLPALAPLCALFGIGMGALLRFPSLVRRHRSVAVVVAALVPLCAAPVLVYLFKQDRQILAAARWARANVPPGELILFRANHRYDMTDYPFNPVLAYYSGHRTFVRARFTPPSYTEAGLERATYALVTSPPPPEEGLVGRLKQLRSGSVLQEESTDWLSVADFRPFVSEDGFAAYKKR